MSIIIKYNPKKINTVLLSLSENLQKFPDNLVITITKGKLLTNNNRPYLFWIDQEENKQLVAVVDESASSQKINQYNSYFLFTPYELVTKDPKTGTVSTLPLSYLNDQKITKKSALNLSDIASRIQSILPLLSLLILTLLVTIIPIISFAITCTYLGTASLFVFIIYKFFLRKHFHFRKILQLSFHATTLPLILDYGLIIFRPSIKINTNFIPSLKQIPFPIIFFILLALFIALGVYEAHEEKGETLAKAHTHHKHTH